MREIRKDRSQYKDHSRLIELKKGGDRIFILGTIKGLLSESKVVEKAISGLVPDLIGLHISNEELIGLGKVLDGRYDSTPMSSLEKMYAVRLSRYGEVQIPPPSLVQAMRSSREMNIPLIALDMDEEEYSELYTTTVSGLTLIRQSIDMKRINRIEFDDPDAERFCIHWDRIVNKKSDFKRLETAREERMARRIKELSGNGLDCLFILELERMQGILHHIRCK